MMADIEKNVRTEEGTDAKELPEKKSADKKADKADKKAKKSDKPALRTRMGAWFKAFKSEFGKIVWTSPRAVLMNTAMVIVTVAIVAAVIGLLDYVFSTTIVGLSRII